MTGHRKGRVDEDEEDRMDVDGLPEGGGEEDGPPDSNVIDEALLAEKDISWDAIAIVKRKIVFSKRPMPLVGKFS
jgi:chromosome transmission fidelity protein 8